MYLVVSALLLLTEYKAQQDMNVPDNKNLIFQLSGFVKIQSGNSKLQYTMLDSLFVIFFALSFFLFVVFLSLFFVLV